MKVLLCVQIKLENSYLREWVEYHKNIGFTNILISDNNDINGEDPKCVINDYIESGFVIIDYKYKNCGKGFQAPLHNETINKYKNQYDWIAFFDLDEFLYLSPKYNNSIINFLESNKSFNEFNGIAINWITYGDNGYLDVSSYNIIDRFDSLSNLSKDKMKNLFFKSFINCKKHKDEVFYDAHSLCYGENVLYCDCNGNVINVNNKVDIPNTNEIYIKHFITKSLNEYIKQKITRGLQWEMYSDNLQLYKDINGWTPEHENYYQFIINNSFIENQKRILICIFYRNKEMLNILNSVSYLSIINLFPNISYKFIHTDEDEKNSRFRTYYNTYKEIYDNDNNYDVIVNINEKVYLNLYLLNRFINVIYDENTIYTEMIQHRGLNNKQISERMFILSKNHLENLVNSEYIQEHNECLDWFPSYSLSIIYKDNRLISNGFLYFNEIKHNINKLTESIFTYVLTNNYKNENHENIYNGFDNMTNFINENKNSFILRIPNIKYIHSGEYIDYYDELNISETIFSIPSY